MNRLSLSIVAIASIIVAGALSSCSKTPDFINPVYDCACGTIEYKGESYALKMAEIVVPDTTNSLSRSYHIVADMRTPEEIDAHVPAHDVTFHMSFETLDDVVFYLPQDSVLHLVQEINHGDDLQGIVNYQGTNGVIQVNQAITGGEESVTFDMNLREVVDGSFVGFEVPFTGSFTSHLE